MKKKVDSSDETAPRESMTASQEKATARWAKRVKLGGNEALATFLTAAAHGCATGDGAALMAYVKRDPDLSKAFARPGQEQEMTTNQLPRWVQIFMRNWMMAICNYVLI